VANEPKPPPEQFKDLMGVVRPLAPSRCAEVQADPAQGVVVTQHAPLRVQEHDGIVVARAPDVTPRVANELSAGPLFPYRKLDLHGLNTEQARAVLRKELPEARARGDRSLLLVCGRGLHSPGHIPVLPDFLVTELSVALSAHLLAFRTAPPEFGGNGAFVLRLRKRD
jgi:DNA-nicking Smr family endonuclease